MDNLLRRVLCISDPEMLQLYEIVIIRNVKNVQFIGVSDGRQALQKALEYKPDLMIVEFDLPKVGDITLEDQWTLIDRVRNELSPHILGVITYRDRSQDMHDIDPPYPWEWPQYPLNELLEKPVLPDNLIEKVNTVLETVDRMKKNFV